MDKVDIATQSNKKVKTTITKYILSMRIDTMEKHNKNFLFVKNVIQITKNDIFDNDEFTKEEITNIISSLDNILDGNEPINILRNYCD